MRLNCVQKYALHNLTVAECFMIAAMYCTAELQILCLMEATGLLTCWMLQGQSTA
jgi:hypothetical protein